MVLLVLLSVLSLGICLDPVHDTKLWDAMLEKYVKPGTLDGIDMTLVDYEGFSSDQSQIFSDMNHNAILQICSLGSSPL